MNQVEEGMQEGIVMLTLQHHLLPVCDPDHGQEEGGDEGLGICGDSSLHTLDYS